MFVAVMVLFMAMILPVAVFVVFVVPMSLVQLPAFPVVVIVRMTPVSTFVGRTLPASLHPAVAMSIGCPISLYPGIARPGNRSTFLIPNWRWRGPDVDRNLG